MQQLNALLQDREVLGTDVARQRLSQHIQMGQIPSPAIKCVLQVLILNSSYDYQNIKLFVQKKQFMF